MVVQTLLGLLIIVLLLVGSGLLVYAGRALLWGGLIVAAVYLAVDVAHAYPLLFPLLIGVNLLLVLHRNE